MPAPPEPGHRSSSVPRADGSSPLTLLNLQLILVLFIVSVVMFAAVATHLGMSPTPGQPGGPGATGTPVQFLAYYAIAVTVGAWLLGMAVNQGCIRQAAHRLRTLRDRGASPAETGQAMFMPYATGVIARGAMVEGGGLLGALAVILNGDLLGLVSVGLALVALGAVFPTRARIERFTEAITRSL
jgi:hypothetical protein